jgi:hypothetical protein
LTGTAGQPPKEKVPKYIPKPITKRKAPGGAIKKGEYRGTEALSEEDKSYIADNARKISVDEIADAIGKKRTTVFKYMDQHGLLGEEDKRDDRIKKAILNNLHNQLFWRVIKKGYSQEEIEYFESAWCAFVIQLDDNVTPTEQIQLRRLIEDQINIDRFIISERKCLDEIASIETEIQHIQSKLWKEDDIAEITFLKSEKERLTASAAALSLSKNTVTRDKDLLVKSQSKLMTDLDVIRTKRVEKYDVSDRSWAKMLLEIREHPKLKKQMGAMAYLSMVATERMRAKLTQDYTFADGEVGQPLCIPEGCVQQELGGMVEVLYVPVEDKCVGW